MDMLKSTSVGNVLNRTLDRATDTLAFLCEKLGARNGICFYLLPVKRK
jgi:hypothetical protein